MNRPRWQTALAVVGLILLIAVVVALNIAWVSWLRS